jgi:CDP-diacylglycerol--glycerol-3-phosphate 3-phosphatidyltransferase
MLVIKKNIVNLANAITLLRLSVAVVVSYSVLEASPYLQILNPFLLILTHSLDGLDGYCARLFNQQSLFGSLFDIATDHTTELMILTVLAKVNLIPMWVVVLFLIRNIFVDTIRASAAEKGHTPFGMMSSRWGYFLVSGRLLRCSYGTIKGITFGWLLLMQPLPYVFNDFWHLYEQYLKHISVFFIDLSVALCVIRGIPVIIEALCDNVPISKRQSGSENRSVAES